SRASFPEITQRAVRCDRRVAARQNRGVDTAHRVSLRWLVGLRWAFIAGAAIAIPLAERLLHLALPVTALLALVGLAAASNIACARWLRAKRAVGARAIAAILLFDGIVLGAFLWLTGGIANPFVLSYV